MILKCTNCGGALQYDAVTDNMLCPMCFSTYEVDWDDMGQLSGNGKGGDAKGVDTGMPKMNYGSKNGNTYNAEGQDEENMDTQIYNCTSCGAELIINDVESSTFCAYCGQPTIVFSRVSKMRKPKYIIPFSVTKEQAHSIIRARLNAGTYVPDSIKNFTPDIIRGIYVPFLLYDVDYYDRQLIQSTHKSGKSSHTYYYYREGENQFTRITVDSSKSFNDESSQRLEPYDFHGMEPFHVGYLSGFYADCMDDDQAKLDAMAMDRSRIMFNEAMLSTVSGSSKQLLVNCPTCKITNAEYVMLPVWFVVFHEGNKHHTIMVNGQTGKMVGAVPCDMGMVKAKAAFYCSLFSFIAAALLGMLYKGASFNEDVMKISIYLIMGIGVALMYVKRQFTSYKKSQELTTASQIKHLASDRTRES